ncbi:APC family permease [Priestia aryabhattai]|uniref:APC family permease n=2 Tax=Priestia TaxID=2800373 RepID=A0AAX6N883_PRIAR|nr:MULTISPECIES: APC family permease [Priestia]AEN88472.1 putative amino-acid permease transmembrane protein [Priestia megaterium WSH-002]MDU9691946.1 APC family permease [Priestia aryabhattai]TPF17613.1 amino acid:proton symporter [Priestia megaterium]TPF24703.1 amino acid:proton symporter [Priestia megaterium]
MNNLNRNMGVFALTMVGLGSIIGSGWLFGAWRAAQIAGPAAIFSWIIGMIVILFIGLSYSELGSMFPEAGGMVKYTQYSHGSFLGFIAGWANWIAIVSVIPVEAVASVQYMSSWPWEWASWTKDLVENGKLTGEGLVWGAGLLIIYFLLNYWTVGLFSKANSLITVFKIVIPGLTIGALLFAGFHSGNFTSGQGFVPNGLASVLTAVATSGIVFSFNGFQSPINMAGEAKNPGRTIPLAVFGSIAIATIIYVLLQVAFIGAVDPKMIVNGWENINFNSPFADLAIALSINWLVIVLYVDAFISPSGTGITYTATTSRMIYGMEKNKYMPSVLGKLHPIYGIPRQAMFFNLGVSFIFLYLFRGWGVLAEVISVATLISYITGPVTVMTLRRTGKDLYRPLRLKGLKVIAPLGFIFASLTLYWARWPLTGQVLFIILIGLPIYFYYQAKNNWKGFGRNLKAGMWMVVYLLCMMTISFLGSEKFGGLNIIKYGWDMLLITFVSLIFYGWALKSGYKTEYMEAATEVNNELKAEKQDNEINEELSV